MTTKESKCCNEIPIIVSKMEKVGMAGQCITTHPGFTSICLNEWVLQISFLSYRQQYGDRAVVPHSKEEKYRYIAYRNLVQSCWGFLGREKLVPYYSYSTTFS
ncbi:uncharacterized protein LOC117114640 [Anneissia japonica]|uniref:uncharacterized protein LOC117114640 n=1 Tax=Anneissia japonica TaxID=1529436 RepID=UPI0014259964|nr:uncharacterized protein LOC117114640 [Anneissia japonica]